MSAGALRRIEQARRLIKARKRMTGVPGLFACRININHPVVAEVKEKLPPAAGQGAGPRVHGLLLWCGRPACA
jgi:hypothetical protein